MLISSDIGNVIAASIQATTPQSATGEALSYSEAAVPPAPSFNNTAQPLCAEVHGLPTQRIEPEEPSMGELVAPIDIRSTKPQDQPQTVEVSQIYKYLTY